MFATQVQQTLPTIPFEETLTPTEKSALVPYQPPDPLAVDRMREKYFRRVKEVLQEQKSLDAKSRKDRPFSTTTTLAIKSYQNKAAVELGKSQQGFFITNPELETSCMKPLALPAAKV